MAHFDVMFTNGLAWASRTFEAPDMHEAERIAVDLAREYMAHSEDTEDWSGGASLGCGYGGPRRRRIDGTAARNTVHEPARLSRHRLHIFVVVNNPSWR